MTIMNAMSDNESRDDMIFHTQLLDTHQGNYVLSYDNLRNDLLGRKGERGCTETSKNNDRIPGRVS